MTFDTGGRSSDSPEEYSSSQSSNNAENTSIDEVSRFPEDKLASLNIKISSSRWVVPVLPNQELELLLNAAIRLSQAGIDAECEPCVKFYSEGLTTSFIKILTDEAVSSWKYNIHHCILMSCSKLLKLISLHMKRDNYHLLKLLSVVFDPDNKFHTHNASRPQELHLAQVDSEHSNIHFFAKSPPEPKNPRGWLVDLINHFGMHKGFENFQERINLEISNFRKQHTKDELNSDTSNSRSYSNKEGELSNPEKNNTDYAAYPITTIRSMC